MRLCEKEIQTDSLHMCLCEWQRGSVCERETAREIIGEKAKERERKQLNECERETYTQRERVCVCLLSHTDKRKPETDRQTG